jgi:hypothetical protein
VPIAVHASLRIQMRSLVAVEATGAGTVDVSGGIYTIPAGLVSLATVTIPVTSTSAVNSVVAVGVTNLAGSFAAGGVAPGEVCADAPPGQACVSGGGLGGIMPLDGFLNVHIIPHIVIFPFDLQGILLGQGGSTFAPMTANGAPWTTGVARIGFSSFPDISTTGSVAASSLSLVSASFVSACGNLFPFTARLTLTPLVPEPAGLALIAIGAAGLIGLALRRRSCYRR